MTTRAYHSSLGRMRMLAGDPSLDFANTLHWRDGREVDFIPDFLGLVDWSVPAGLLQPMERDLLAAAAVADPVEASRLHGCIIDLRTVWRDHLARATRPGSGDLRLLDDTPLTSMLNRVTGHGDFIPRVTKPQADSSGQTLRLAAVRLALSIASLCFIPVDRQIGRCEGDPCGGFFLNTSRSKPRRWCSMDTCGNRAKVRHFRSQLTATDARG